MQAWHLNNLLGLPSAFLLAMKEGGKKKTSFALIVTNGWGPNNHSMKCMHVATLVTMLKNIPGKPQLLIICQTYGLPGIQTFPEIDSYLSNDNFTMKFWQ